MPILSYQLDHYHTAKKTHMSALKVIKDNDINNKSQKIKYHEWNINETQ